MGLGKIKREGGTMSDLRIVIEVPPDFSCAEDRIVNELWNKVRIKDMYYEEFRKDEKGEWEWHLS
jgi:hypothetical protein